ncbi:MAG: hypothetical protein AVO38_00775 [delta proteobacterium ML8_D]|jgi:hypothetical protein|nr:MAG: hypothetical protein AVO38_00775 [delta proteobacterium ML8_D]
MQDIKGTKVTKIEIENCLRELLREEGYTLDNRDFLSKLSSDIKATKDNESWYIEVLGYGTSGRKRVEDFYRAFFQSVSRLNNEDCGHIVIAMAESSRKILHIRAKVYEIAWERIAKVFPELEIWLVDVERKKYQRTSWDYHLKYNE